MDKSQLKYTKSHEWIESAGPRRKVGISDFAQSQLGDVVYIELPEAGKEVQAGDEVCVVESCKATASIYAPVVGKVVAVNKGLTDAPESINKSPYGDGWIFELEVAEQPDEAGLLGETDYAKTCEEH